MSRKSFPVLERDEVPRQLLAHGGAARGTDAERERFATRLGPGREIQPLAQARLLARRGALGPLARALREGLRARGECEREAETGMPAPPDLPGSTPRRGRCL